MLNNHSVIETSELRELKKKACLWDRVPDELKVKILTPMIPVPGANQSTLGF